jgi:hypothetical protein
MCLRLRVLRRMWVLVKLNRRKKLIGSSLLLKWILRKILRVILLRRILLLRLRHQSASRLRLLRR